MEDITLKNLWKVHDEKLDLLLKMKRSALKAVMEWVPEINSVL